MYLNLIGLVVYFLVEVLFFLLLELVSEACLIIRYSASKCPHALGNSHTGYTLQI